ncbi:hypothetical protein TUM4249_12400 [Shewanella sp. KT0246]|nr:hypothetical protein TUM4249_12400 [Shewanella sp. KT0246]
MIKHKHRPYSLVLSNSDNTKYFGFDTGAKTDSFSQQQTIICSRADRKREEYGFKFIKDV